MVGSEFKIKRRGRERKKKGIKEKKEKEENNYLRLACKY